ncbi:hypothetical protein AN964_10005 [Heyndrickxia shackletonii]|uniref:Exonuclease domain-containing protein n=1 Tax=Heyndrickxia shackletonii TaxID=157838 RepID=A0A0Q3TIP6_9BACI|nr:exonuclease domain-containing protein [Heyndrickxia shackletonii]KQL53800.1 hypothetical protein AN964_10005 [Heyndrickxia shackletonii]NEY97935.1 3'-5' exonuclease [Heyndrickxia shackletonii]
MGLESIIQYLKDIQGKINVNIISAFHGGQTFQQKAFIRQMEKDDSKNQLMIPFSELTVAIVDIETTGFFPEKGDVIFSIGAIKMKGANILEKQTYYSLLNTNIPIAEDILKLTRITETDLIFAPSRKQVLHDFFAFIQDVPLVAHHSTHERKFFQHESWKLFRTPFRNRIMDTSFLSRVIYPELDLKTLDECCLFHKIEIKNRHHALGDAILTAKLWSLYMEEIQKRGFKTLCDIYEYLSKQ